MCIVYLVHARSRHSRPKLPIACLCANPYTQKQLCALLYLNNNNNNNHRNTISTAGHSLIFIFLYLFSISNSLRTLSGTCNVYARDGNGVVVVVVVHFFHSNDDELPPNEPNKIRAQWVLCCCWIFSFFWSILNYVLPPSE